MTNEAPTRSDHRTQQFHDDLQTEYWRLLAVVDGFDQRLVTVKSWGVTGSLASLGLGFQQRHYGLFLVAALSAAAFWLLEALTKGHQMRYYPRIREIEVAAFALYRVSTADGEYWSPGIDSSWTEAFSEDASAGPMPRERAYTGAGDAVRHILLKPHVALPHVFVAALGLCLFALGLAGSFGQV